MPKSKGLNTYAYYICLISMFGEKYKGLRIAVSNSAIIELMKEEKTLYYVVQILEEGYDAPRKRKEGTIMSRIYSAMKTGLTMSFTTIFALIIGMIFTKSEVIRQIMLIVFIGLIIDLINTWVQNVGILRMYLEKKHKIAKK